MSHLNQDLGDAVRRVMDERPGGKLSLRQVQIRTGVDYETVSRMRNGLVPRMDKIVAFARGFGLDVNQWLTLAGYAPVEGEPSPIERLEAGAAELAREFGRPIPYAFNGAIQTQEGVDQQLALWRRALESGEL